MEAKGYTLAILGDEGVGKTSFCNKYLTKTFTTDVPPTIGGEYFQKLFSDNNQIIKVDIYASSGNKKSQKIAKYLYKDARSILLMFNLNVKSTFDSLSTYLENIRMNSVEDPIIYLAGNFCDEDKSNRRISDDKITQFEKENNLKYFEISCKTGKNIEELMKELTKEILLTEKYYTSTIDKDISDISNMDDGGKEIEKLTKSLKVYYKDTKERKTNFMRCKNCDKLLFVKFRNTYNEVSFICNTCNNEQNVNIKELDKYIDKLSEKVICFECLKSKEEKIKLEYCNKCKHYVCPSCKKAIVKQLRSEGSEIHKLVPYYLMDIICFDHLKKILGYCKECKKSLCFTCFDSHKAHDNTFFEDIIDKLRDENREELRREQNNLNKFKSYFEDCINAIKNEVTNYITLKSKEIKLKEQLISQLSNIQYNQQLIETVKNMRYMKPKKYEKNLPWDQKLTDIFEVIGQPIQIRKINITKNHDSYIAPDLVELKEKNELAEEENNEENNKYALISETFKEVTDFCSMNNDKYLGISFNIGVLELYENIVKSKVPIHSYEIFKKGEGIKSIHKSSRNVNNYFFCGKEKIKNIEFYDNYKTLKTLMEIEEPKTTFNYCLEQDKFIITSDINNKIVLYDKNSNKIGDLTDSIDHDGNKDIYSMDEVMNSIIYISYNKVSDNASVNSLNGRSSYYFNEQDEPNADAPARNSDKDQSETGTKIIELDDNNYRIKREHILSDYQELIGVISERLVLIRDDNFSSVILFDAKMFKNVQRFYFEVGEKPIFSSALNKRNNLIDFVLVSDKMKMLQYIYDLEHKNVTQISGLKIKAKNEETDAEIEKIGNIIHIPFKGFVKYIGENNFVVINY